MPSQNCINNQIPNNDFLVQRTVADVPVILTVKHTDNTVSSSDANVLIQVGGASGGDPSVTYNIGGSDIWSTGTDNSDSDAYVISLGSTLGTGNVSHCDTSGRWTYPQQPFLQAELSAPTSNDKTGDGTVYTVVFDSVILDNRSLYNASTGHFLPDISSNYLVTGNVVLSNLGVTHTTGTLKVVNDAFATFTCASMNVGVAKDAGNLCSLTFSFVGQGNTGGAALYITVTVSGGTKTVGIDSGNLGIWMLG